ncbi:MAG TPA: GTPase HflX [Vicinamibacteria bacterium]|nr:GTPase HflX [Vicinamibacteria bacterium]
MTDPGERALLVGLSLGRRDRARTESSLEELALLAWSAGACVVGTLLQERARRDPATLIGRGKVEEVKRACAEEEAEVVILDEDLAPAQQRNLEQAVGTKTLDRTQVILDIFARRARTREGRLQVELAQLDYLLPRLGGKGALLSRLGGGIGTRGPGETKLETDRRRIRQRIQSIRREIEHVRRERHTRREARGRREAPVVALVGYTNAGKSTLFNALTRGGAPVSDQLFMTLDPLVRKVRLGPGREVLLVDTVGFIQKLPHQLVAAFRATLEEVKEADLLLHVVDASSPGVEERDAAVESVLREIGAGDRPRLLVLNKADRTPAERIRALAEGGAGSAVVSALSGDGLDGLLSTVASRLDLSPRRVRLSFAAGDRRGVAGVYAAGRVLGHEVREGRVLLEAELAGRTVGRYREHLV